MSYRLPKHKESVDELEKDGRLNSPASLLRQFGFEYCHFQKSSNDMSALLLESAQEIVTPKNREGISRIFLYSGVEDEIETGSNSNVLDLFRYPVAELRHKLGLTTPNVLAVSQQGCSGMLSIIDMASRLLATSDTPNDSILCVGADTLPKWSKREIMYNLMSDAAASVIVSRDCSKNRIVHFHQEIQSYYWDTPQHENELLASYFPLAQRAIETAVAGAHLKMSDIKWLIPHNVSMRSWEILAKLLHIPMNRIWTENIARIGHTVSCDHFINLVEMEKEGLLKKGDNLALFTFGFGASWSCLILEH